MKEDVIKEDLIFCQPPTTSTKAVDVKKLVENIFKRQRSFVGYGLCNLFERTPAMLGQKSSFGARVKADAPHITVTHCVLHKHALATKTFPSKLAEV